MGFYINCISSIPRCNCMYVPSPRLSGFQLMRCNINLLNFFKHFGPITREHQILHHFLLHYNTYTLSHPYWLLPPFKLSTTAIITCSTSSPTHTLSNDSLQWRLETRLYLPPSTITKFTSRYNITQPVRWYCCAFMSTLNFMAGLERSRTRYTVTYVPHDKSSFSFFAFFAFLCAGVSLRAALACSWRLQ